jgi:hypothetical protein
MTGTRTRFETITTLEGHRDTKGFADEMRTIDKGKILWAKVDDNETHNGIRVIFYNIEGGDEYFWSPRDAFTRSARRLPTVST